MSSFRFYRDPPRKCHEMIKLRDGDHAPRAAVALLCVTLMALHSSNPRALIELIVACSEENHTIQGKTANLLQSKGLIRIQGQNVIIPELVKHLVLSMQPPPGSGEKLLSPYA